jgi:two-component system phosphate regulon response regulator PhoB
VARVLVAESEADPQRMIGTSLAAAGHDVTVVDDGLTALATAAGTRPELCILDVVPLRGVELCRALRGDPVTALSPIIFVTSMMDVFDIDKVLASGADEFLIRPFSPANLLAHVAALLKRATFPV